MSSESTRDLQTLAARLAPDVLDAAVTQATERAEEELTRRLTQAIVDEAIAVPSKPSVEPVDSVETGLYAFAIMAARPADLTGMVGIDGTTPLSIVHHEGLGLVVSPVRLDLLDAVSEDDLSEAGSLATLARRHDAVVRGMFEHGAVLPLRFGTVVRDEEAARRLLAEQAAPARERLSELGTHREWGVRLRRAAADSAADDESHDRASRRDMSGTSYLAARREAIHSAELAQQNAVDITSRVMASLQGHSIEMVRRNVGNDSMIVDLAFLVPEADEEAFQIAEKQLASELVDDGVVLEQNGPWPPYSFASFEIHAETRSAGEVIRHA